MTTGRVEQAAAPPVLWAPPPDAATRTAVGRFAAFVSERHGVTLDDYGALWQWSIGDIDAFWAAVWDFFGVQADGNPRPVRTGDDLPGTRWFPGTRLNWAEHALAEDRWGDGSRTAVVAFSQTRGPVTLTMAELRRQVGRARAGLAALGVGPGTRVAGYLPNIPEALVGLLATASLGATWSSCAPEFGVPSVVDRFGQIGPTVLVAVDGYRYGGRTVDRRDAVAALRRQLPTVTTTVVVPYLDPAAPPPPGALGWDELLAADGPLAFERVPFAHPLYVLYSSGTTGRPKAIIHGHGGMLLAHLRDLSLHLDLGEGDRFCWFTTTGWMMWNFLVSGLCVGATVVCFDGDPGHPDLGTLWRLAADSGTTLLGVSAPFIMACRSAGLRPCDDVDLHALRAVGSTGAPLAPAGYRWVAEAATPGAPVASISGGTDICSIWVGHAPTVPVWEGEISCRALGAAVAAYDPDGHAVVGQQGELVVTEPVPSMPVGLWGDADGSRLRATYFGMFPGVWSHGDWITITDRGSCIISGRSDATLNRGGIRVGTAELYAVVEAMAEVADALVVHLEDDAGGPGELVLFVVPATGHRVDDDLRHRVADEIRRALSPRHVPDRVVGVTAVPRTLSGKKLEVPVKRILRGADPDQVAAAGALSDPAALDQYVELARRWQAATGP